MTHKGSYKDLIVWRKSTDSVVLVYACTENFPKSEQFGLTSQIRRCAVSIPSNTAEGSKRLGDREFVRFLGIAYGSGAELETQLELTKRLNLIGSETYTRITEAITEVMKMLNALIKRVNESTTS